ncbi:MAG: DNA-directed RNA polymerase subunit A' [Candidatus Diapherotrites archaeon]|uniref:DNA-directed RNA polymerase subunit n=1 Tax=Candidatus Iainarchaeum sp. TaxID=3101447 RepID=A0A7K4BYB2_9ARCH|nr:DNA-directed RNA polymerase subunit A' [Candidatus Diapherotrites archaeon]
MIMKKIGSVEFSILGPEMIRKMSAIEIKTPETYDKDGYPMEGGLMDAHLGVINPGIRCKTCGQGMRNCPGHFGHIELERPVVHSEFGRKLELLMNTTCKDCGNILLPEEQIKKLQEEAKGKVVDKTKKIMIKTKTVKKCPHCSAPAHKTTLDKPTNFFYNKERIYPTQIREWVEKIPEEHLRILGYDTTRIKPEWFIMTSLQVPPITIRPSITLDNGIKSEDDLTHKLVDIIRINQRLKDNIEAGAPQLIIEDLWDLLQYHVTTYFDNNTAGVPPAKHRSGRPLRTIIQRLKGKKGRFRYNLTGKRVNHAARTIIVPDPYIDLSELGIPEEAAKELTVPEFVTEWNLETVKKIVEKSDRPVYIIRPNGTRRKVTEENKEEIVKEIDIGYRIERNLKDGDIVLFNRQPSLHRMSMMAHTARIMPGKVFRMNPIVCPPYNADFDGDEMNCHVPQTEEGKAEAKKLMLARDQIISPRFGAPVIAPKEDGVSGAFALTMPQTEFTKETAMQLMYEIGVTELPKPDRGKKYSGKLIFSQILPKDLNLEYESYTSKIFKQAGMKPEDGKIIEQYMNKVKIVNGNIESGVIDSASLSEGKGVLVDTIAREYDSIVLEQFYHDLNRLTGYILTEKGMTASLAEYDVSNNIETLKNKVINETMKKAEELVESYKKGTMEIIPGRTIQESFEQYMMRISAEAKDKVEKAIMQEKLQYVTGEEAVLNTIAMILSKSRGSTTNLMNIAGFWGQASVREGRPKKGFKKRLITSNERADEGLLAGGFITNNFLDGMTAKQYFYHSMGGRQGEVDTGVSTKVSGYLYRRLANSLKDIVSAPDGTVRTASNSLIQYQYGEDGVFPKNTNKGKSVDVLEEYKKMKAKKN